MTNTAILAAFSNIRQYFTSLHKNPQHQGLTGYAGIIKSRVDRLSRTRYVREICEELGQAKQSGQPEQKWPYKNRCYLMRGRKPGFWTTTGKARRRCGPAEPAMLPSSAAARATTARSLAPRARSCSSSRAFGGDPVGHGAVPGSASGLSASAARHSGGVGKPKIAGLRGRNSVGRARVQDSGRCASVPRAQFIAFMDYRPA